MTVQVETAQLAQDFMSASELLGMSENEQKICLGVVDNQISQISTEWFISVSLDAQNRAQSIIGITNGMKTIVEKSNGKYTIPGLIKDFFDSHENLMAHLSDYDKSEREAQIGAAVAALTRQ